MRKTFFSVLTVMLILGLTVPALGADVTFHGDLNNRFMLYTNQSGFYSGAGDNSTAAADQIKKDGVTDSWGEFKYRLWADAATNDGNVKGVFAIEVGAVRYGNNTAGAGTSRGGGFSGDNVTMETRWAYTDLQLPMVDGKSRLRMGLQPFTVNKYLWDETVGGVVLYGGGDAMDYQFGWGRGHEVQRTGAAGGAEDVDGYTARLNFKPSDGLKIGVFGLYTHGGANGTGANGAITAAGYELKSFAAGVDFGIYNVGVDGGFKAGNFFVNWDLIYQTGDFENVTFTDTALTPTANTSVDLNAYYARASAGLKMDALTFTYTFAYATGDDNGTDKDFDGYMAVDVDNFDGVVLFEGGYTDDVYFTERYYVLDKGMIMNKLALDYKASDKLKVGAAVLYMLTAEDIKYTPAVAGSAATAVDEIGTELDAYISYMLYKNVEFAVNAGYLMAGDAMDYFEEASIQNGSSDEDIFRSTARIRYTF
jgi:hypothetical protein